MPTPMNNTATTNTAIDQCRTRERTVNCGGRAILRSSAGGRNFYRAWLLRLAGSSRRRLRIYRRARAEQWIVGRFDPRGQDQRVKIDVAAVARRFAFDMVDRQG